MPSPENAPRKKLRAYEWKSHPDEDWSVVIIAENVIEAKKLGWNITPDRADWIDVKVKWLKKANTDGLSKGEIDHYEGLRREMYGWIEAECQQCKKYKTLSQVRDNKCICTNCEEVPSDGN